jgi:hypothetical protein
MRIVTGEFKGRSHLLDELVGCRMFQSFRFAVHVVPTETKALKKVGL